MYKTYTKKTASSYKCPVFIEEEDHSQQYNETKVKVFCLNSHLQKKYANMFFKDEFILTNISYKLLFCKNIIVPPPDFIA